LALLLLLIPPRRRLLSRGGIGWSHLLHQLFADPVARLLEATSSQRTEEQHAAEQRGDDSS
jgi:hypothetical protein